MFIKQKIKPVFLLPSKKTDVWGQSFQNLIKIELIFFIFATTKFQIILPFFDGPVARATLIIEVKLKKASQLCVTLISWSCFSTTSSSRNFKSRAPPCCLASVSPTIITTTIIISCFTATFVQSCFRKRVGKKNSRNDPVQINFRLLRFFSDVIPSSG